MEEEGQEVQGGQEKNLEERYPGISEMGLCIAHDYVGVFHTLLFATLILFCIILLVPYFVGESFWGTNAQNFLLSGL